MLVLYVCLVPGLTSIDAPWNLGKWPPPTIPSATSNCTSVRESQTCIHVLLWYCIWRRSLLYNPPLKVMTLIFLNTTHLMQTMILRFDSTNNSPSELKRFHFLTGDRPWSARFSCQRGPEEGFNDVRNVLKTYCHLTCEREKKHLGCWNPATFWMVQILEVDHVEVWILLNVIFVMVDFSCDFQRWPWCVLIDSLDFFRKIRKDWWLPIPCFDVFFLMRARASKTPQIGDVLCTTFIPKCPIMIFSCI